MSSEDPLLDRLVFSDTDDAIIALGANASSEDGSGNRTLTAECMVMPVDSKVWSTVCEGILSVVVGACGLMGNGATIAVLSRPAFKETFHKLLVSLSVFDSLFIGGWVMGVMLGRRRGGKGRVYLQAPALPFTGIPRLFQLPVWNLIARRQRRPWALTLQSTYVQQYKHSGTQLYLK